MQLNFAFLDLPEPSLEPCSDRAPPAAWEQLDEAARIAALGVLARRIARMLVDAPAKETGNE